MEFLTTITDFFFDKKRSLTSKSSLVFIFFTMFVVADVTFKITYNWETERKMSMLKTVHETKTLFKNDTAKINTLNKVETELLESKHYTEFFTEIYLPNWSIENTKPEVIKPKKDNSSTEEPLYLPYAIMSSSWLHILVFVIMFLNFKQENYFTTLFGAIFILSGFAAISSGIILNIPFRFDSSTATYFLYAFELFTMFFFLAALISYAMKKTKPSPSDD